MHEHDASLPPLAEQAAELKTCPRCGAHFACGARTGQCWCATLPPLLAVPGMEAGCYCPRCLAQIVAQQQ
ncbi:hypothetical protein AGMMS49960_06160 [Betaproteobacteria bacterium]|nr:hypothetical protein AGMMS49543_01480 [Betaproteobacteria bacterium]GHT99817.1 hypothetical protein AGMMS49960_06160 [Betaproteobacteria bacterium]GHU09729.1 hypothetical protein AGMMS50225_11320 [Betaproteobacteria bacterium]GHU19095.1 hypothetical protein AGMMS50243_10380 [Betaproteobacteria bacterium]